MLILALSFMGCEEILNQTDIGNSNVVLLAPTDGAELNFTSVNFNWSAIEGATGYRLQIATPTFENATQVVTDVVVDSLTVFNVQLTPNRYQWRIKGTNSEFETPFSSASFSVVGNDDFQDNTVNLTSPEDGLVTNMGEFSLMWDAIEAATQYRVEIEDNSDQSLVNESQTTTNSFPYAFGEGDFTWRVRAEKDGQFTLYSSRNILVDTTAPNIPTLLTPTDGFISTSESVDFTWSREPIGGSTELDSLYIYRDMQLTDLVEKAQVTDGFTTILENNIYYWTMQAFDGAGNVSGPSSTFSFTVNQ